LHKLQAWPEYAHNKHSTAVHIQCAPAKAIMRLYAIANKLILNRTDVLLQH
jgi:hypothetical protein